MRHTINVQLIKVISISNILQKDFQTLKRNSSINTKKDGGYQENNYVWHQSSLGNTKLGIWGKIMIFSWSTFLESKRSIHCTIPLSDSSTKSICCLISGFIVISKRIQFSIHKMIPKWYLLNLLKIQGRKYAYWNLSRMMTRIENKNLFWYTTKIQDIFLKHTLVTRIPCFTFVFLHITWNTYNYSED